MKIITLLYYSKVTNKTDGELMLQSFKLDNVIFEKIVNFTNKFKENFEKFRGLIADFANISNQSNTINHTNEFYKFEINKIKTFRSFR